MNYTPSLVSISLRYLRKLPLNLDFENKYSFTHAFIAELLNLGFLIKNSESVRPLDKKEYEEVLRTLIQMRGGHVVHSPLFKNFPDEYPQDSSDLYIGILGYFGVRNAATGKYVATSVPQTAQQVIDAWEVIQQRKTAENVKWINIQVVSNTQAIADVLAWAESLIYGSTVIQETYWEDLWWVVNNLGLQVDISKIKIKETLVRFAAKDWNLYNRINVRTATDLLRLFAYIKEQDISLAEKVSLKGLKYNRPRRNAIMAFINSDKCRVEDMATYSGLWKQIFAKLHPYDYQKKYPNAIRKIQDIQTDSVKTFESIARNQVDKNKMAEVYAKQPSLFIRRLSEMLGHVNNEFLCSQLNSLDVSNVPLPLLLNAWAALSHTSERTVINKKGKFYNIGASKEVHFDISIALVGKINDRLEGLKSEWSSKTVYIDPLLLDIMIPSLSRKASESLINIAYGSKLPITSDIIRIFMYWKENNRRTDYDLSVRYFDSDFKLAGQVSWNAYGNNNAIRHSGDIVSAPFGASEFIDVNVPEMAKKCRYIVPAMFRFTGESFKEVSEFFAGYMERDSLDINNEQIFDPKTVAFKVAATDRTDQLFYPFAFDLEQRKAVYIGLYGSGRRTIESNRDMHQTAKNLLNFNRCDYYSFVSLLAQANRAMITNDKDNADVIIDLDYILSLYGEDCYTLPEK